MGDLLMELSIAELKRIEQFASKMRNHVLAMSLAAGRDSSHFGGGLSIVDITATLFGSIMKYDPGNPNWDERDRYILSKGHGCLGYYAALIELGVISIDQIQTFEKTGSNLMGHPVMNRELGIEFSNGSLGMGLSLGVGVALAGKRRKKGHNVYVILGDGECNEGSVWEAAMAASHFKLDNLIGVIDRNNLQQTGTGEEIMNLGKLADKWKSFGWKTVEADGHNLSELYDILLKGTKKNMPLMVVANTIKGKGFDFSENNNDWHHAVLTKNQYQLAIDQL
jgi:transketolase